MSDENPYSAPTADLMQQHESDANHGSVEKALAGDFQFSLGDVFSEAWGAVGGNKLTVFGVFVISILVMTVFSGAILLVESFMGVGMEDAPTLNSFLATLPINLLSYAVNAVIITGYVVIGAKMSMAVPTGIGDLFRFSAGMLKGLITYILMMILLLLGFLLLVIPGLYLSIAYQFAIPLALEKGMSPWEALETSRKALSKCWFRMLGLNVVIMLLFMLSILTLGIASIWLLPLAMIGYGIVYRNIFGLEEESLKS